MTLLFVSSLRILYSESSDDPIFPADVAVPVSGDSKLWYRNSDHRARPLACLNQIEICTPDERLYLPFRKPDEDTNWEWTPEFTLLFTSLFQTDIFDSIKMPQGRALKAQEAVAGYFSTSLGPEAWANEVENLVTIAHARSQINAWSVASGEDSIHEKERYQLVNGTENTCGLFKYRPQGFATLKGIPLLAVLLLTVALWVFSLESRTFGPGGAFRKPFTRVRNFFNRSQYPTVTSPITGAVRNSGTHAPVVRSTESQSPAAWPEDSQPPSSSVAPFSGSRTLLDPDTAEVHVHSPDALGDTETSSAARPTSSTVRGDVEEGVTTRAASTEAPPPRETNMPNDSGEVEFKWKPLVCYFLLWEGPRLLYRTLSVSLTDGVASSSQTTTYGTIR